MAVPIHRGMRMPQTLELPDSPPSTPPQSPTLLPRQMVDDRDSDIDNDDDDATEVAEEGTETETVLSACLTDMSLGSNEAGQEHLAREAATALLAPHSSEQAPDAKAQPKAVPTGTGLMPATPEMSPDQDVCHRALETAKGFFCKVFADFADASAVEDAGIELVCPGWSGAVLKTGASAFDSPEAAARSYSSTSSSASSSDTKRTLYVSMPQAVDQSQLREQVLAILDTASEKLGCDTVIISLERNMRDFALVLHGLCYVGGQVVSIGRSGQEDVHHRMPSSSTMSAASNTESISGFSPRQDLVLVAIEL